MGYIGLNELSGLSGGPWDKVRRRSGNEGEHVIETAEDGDSGATKFCEPLELDHSGSGDGDQRAWLVLIGIIELLRYHGIGPDGISPK